MQYLSVLEAQNQGTFLNLTRCNFMKFTGRQEYNVSQKSIAKPISDKHEIQFVPDQ